MKRKTITLENNFHNTEVTLRAEVLKDGTLYLSPRQVRKAQNSLCGSDSCCCSDGAGCRPSRVDVNHIGAGFINPHDF